MAQAIRHHKQTILDQQADGNNGSDGYDDEDHDFPVNHVKRKQGERITRPFLNVEFGSDSDSDADSETENRADAEIDADADADAEIDADKSADVDNQGMDVHDDQGTESDVSVYESIYSSYPSKHHNSRTCNLCFMRRRNEFYAENGLSELNPGETFGIIECLARLYEVAEPNIPKFHSSGYLLRHIRKEMKKSPSKSASGTPLTLSQKHCLNQLIGAYVDGKQYGARTVRWNVSVLCALSKLLNQEIIVVSPPLVNQSSVGLLCLTPTQYYDYRFRSGANVFPTNDEEEIETEYESDGMPLELPHKFHVPMASPGKLLENGKCFIVRAVMDFDSDRIIGYSAVANKVDDYGLSDTDSDDNTNVIPSSASTFGHGKQARGDEVINDPYLTPQTKKQKNDNIGAAVPPAKASATAARLANPYAKLELTSGKSVSHVVTTQEGFKDNNGSIVSSGTKGGWGDSPLVMEHLNKKNSSSHQPTIKSRSQVVLEFTNGITDRSTGEKVYLAMLSSTPGELWYLKGNIFNDSFHLFFEAGGPTTPLKQPASCYQTWKDVFIRRSWHGENKYQRKGRIQNGQAPYPVSRAICEFRCNPSGFPIDVLLKKFESDFRSMCSDGRVCAAYLFNHLEESGSGLLNMFLEGKFRKGNEKNVPYKNENEVKDLFARDIENGFKHGFSRVVMNNFFDKHYCDFTIQQFLISLGYHSFEELKDEERSLLYKCGRFPVWEDISEEPISVSI